MKEQRPQPPTDGISYKTWRAPMAKSTRGNIPTQSQWRTHWKNTKEPNREGIRWLHTILFPTYGVIFIGKKKKSQCFKIHSELDFILTSCCSCTLERLSIFSSNVVTLPESLNCFKRLHMLEIRDCNEFREIPRLSQKYKRYRYMHQFMTRWILHH